eukprot:1266263-Alexandrium_andersonii.AAC.1
MALATHGEQHVHRCAYARSCSLAYSTLGPRSTASTPHTLGSTSAQDMLMPIGSWFRPHLQPCPAFRLTPRTLCRLTPRNVRVRQSLPLCGLLDYECTCALQQDLYGTP